MRAQLATGYTLTSKGAKARTDRQGVTAAAGSIYSHPRDVARYLAALLNGGVGEHGTILKPDTLVLMFDGDHLIVRADLDRLLHAAQSGVPSFHCSLASTRTQWAFATALGCSMQGFMTLSMTAQAMRPCRDHRRLGGGCMDVLADHGEARFFLFVTLSNAVEERLRDELAVVSAVITGSTVIAKRSDHMTPLTERRAG